SEGKADGPALDFWQLSQDQVAPFFGLGFGYLQVEGLFEAMEHENLLARPELWQDVQQALAGLADPEVCQRHLQAGAERLLAAREVLYPAAIHLVDLSLLDADHLDEALPAAAAKGSPFNVIACTVLLERLAREQPEQFATLRQRIADDSAEVCGGI